MRQYFVVFVHKSILHQDKRGVQQSKLEQLTDTNAILAVLIKDGLTLEEIQEGLPIYVERRTLQRRIKKSEIAIPFIKCRADRFAKPEIGTFTEVVETELMGIHEGNFARYRIAPSEFKK
ncbi:MAG: hypothetical protein ACTHYC_15675 [Sphingobacterium sp.]